MSKISELIKKIKGGKKDMKKLLIIDATMGESKAHYVYSNLELNVSDYDVKTLKLNEMDIPFLTSEIMASKAEKKYDTPVTKFCQELTTEFASADAYVFICPTWNLGVPAILKAYIDVIFEAGVVFKYSETGAIIGLLEGKKALVINASGGEVDDAHIYLENVLNFMGVANETIRVKGTAYLYPTNEDMLTNLNYNKEIFN